MDIANLSAEFEKYEASGLRSTNRKRRSLAITQSKLLPTPSEAAFETRFYSKFRRLILPSSHWHEIPLH